MNARRTAAVVLSAAALGITVAAMATPAQTAPTAAHVTTQR